MAESLALARYWSELNPHNRSQGRSREALWASVVAHPDWMTLRDTQGCSPIMRALRLHPFLIRSLTPRRVPHSFLERDRDAAGRPLAFHLFLGLTNTENRSQTGKNPKEPYEWLLRLPCLDTRGRGLLDQWEQDKDEGTMLAGGSLWRPEGMASLAKANELGPPSNWLSARPEDMDAWLDVFEGCPENIPYNQLPIPAFLFLESPVSWNREALANWSSHPPSHRASGVRPVGARPVLPGQRSDRVGRCVARPAPGAMAFRSRRPRGHLERRFRVGSGPERTPGAILSRG